MLNDKANVQREINRRISDVYHTYKRLDPYWKNGAIPELWDGKSSKRIVSKILEIL